MFAFNILDDKEGGQQSPFLLEKKMLKEQIRKLVEEKISGTDCFLVDVKVSPSKIMVYIDKPAGIKVEDCIELNRFLQQQLEETDVLEHHELEVSSPGMDEPLKVLQQYLKRIGREVSVVTFDGLKHVGILESADDNEIVLLETIIKKENGRKEKTVQNTHLPLSNIKETKVIFSFEKILK
jgi:ribosome maturation factor RimP